MHIQTMELGEKCSYVGFDCGSAKRTRGDTGRTLNAGNCNYITGIIYKD